jgi:hypothetical protein
MIKNILLLTTVFASVTTFAQETWVGYKPIEKVQAPHKDVAMAAVMQIQTVTLLEKDKDNYEVVDTDGTKKVTDPAKLNADLRTLQIETCRNQGLKKCPVFKTKYSGTGFINNGRNFYTCRHMVHNWAVIAARENGITVDQISPPIRLLNNNKNIVYNSAEAQTLMKFDAINTDTRLDYVLKDNSDPKNNKLDLVYALSEFVALVAASDLIPARAAAISLPLTKGDQVYLSGFPLKTSIFGGNRKGDTPGDIMVSSTGVVTGLSTLQEVFLSSAVATHGMSGGLVTKATGDMVGIVCSGPEDESDTSNISSRSTFLDPQGHEKLWDTLEQTPI